MTDIALRILLSAQDSASRVISGFGSQLLKMSGDFKPLMIGAGLVAGAVIGIGAVAVDMAAKFHTAILSLVAHAGLAQSQVQNVTNAVLAMAPAVGRSPIELADALYPILSAFSGITDQSAKTQLALDTLKKSFETVAGTTVDGTAVANAAVGTFNALGLSTNNAGLNAQRMSALFDVMDKTVQLANTNWDQYKNTVTKVATSANTAGVSFNESQAALATLTSQGMSAMKAGTYLVNTFNTLEIKTDSLAKHAKTLKIAFDEHKYASMSLADKIKYLNEVTGGNSQKLLALMGNNSTALQTFKKLSTGIATYSSDLQALGHSQGALQSSFDTASQGFQFAMSQAKAAIDVVLIKIGTNLLPMLTDLVHAVIPVINWFMSMADAVSKNSVAMDAIKSVLLGVAVVIAIVLVNAFIAWATAAWAAAVATLAATWPILLIGVIVAAVVFGIIQATRHWGAIIQWLGDVWKTISTHIGEAFSWLGTTIHNIIFGVIAWFQNLSGGFKALLAVALVVFFPIVALILGVILVVTHWGAIMKWFGGVFSAIGTFIHSIISKIGDAFSGLGSAIHGVWNGIVQTIKNAINFIIGIINGFISGIDKLQVNVGPVHIGFDIPKIPYLATGGYIEAGGIAMVHIGERVIPAKASSLGAGGASGQAVVIGPVNIYGPSRAMADDFLKEISRRLKQNGVLVTWTSGGSAV